MSGLRKQELAAIEAVARHFSATCEKGKDASRAYLTVAGKRVAVEVTAIKRPVVGRGRVAGPRLRFDKVVLRLIGTLQANLGEVVPGGQAVILTITAPIRLPAKTTAAVEDKVRACLTRRAARVEVNDAIHGNQVRIRLVKGVAVRAPKVIGFVHNPDSEPGVLLDVTQSLLEHIGAAAARRAPAGFAGDRWLVLAMEDGVVPIEMYKQVHAQLGVASDFDKILLVLAGGRVEMLAG